MIVKKISLLLLVFILSAYSNLSAQKRNLVVRIAKLQIDSTRLEEYKEALEEHAKIAVRVEPGVITLYAVYEKTRPTHVTVFEIYANPEAYEFHIKTAHFLKYKTGTKEMVKSLELIETIPIALETKGAIPQ